jgi:cyclic pyranopterin phosphate synthase
MSKGKKQLYDNHGRVINYLRLAVTDRCNLRCFYCMPEKGIQYVPKEDLLSYEEMERLIQLLATMGITKVRITGGEPFVRKGMMGFLGRLTKIEGIEQVHITTNGTMSALKIPTLQEIGIKSVNLSLDSLDADRFFEITRRNVFPQVQKTLNALIDARMPTKINAVVMDGRNETDILPMVALTEKLPISVRFIEEMPFNGQGRDEAHIEWNYQRILDHIMAEHSSLQKVEDGPSSTSLNYKIPGWKGSVGVIPAFSRTFCGTCNRIRITPKGLLKTCLYDDGVFNVKDLMRNGASDAEVKQAFLEALSYKAKDGFEAEQNRQFGTPVKESMSTIGG